MRTFRELYGDDLADSIDRLRGGQRRESDWERSKRQRERREEHESLVKVARSCLLGAHGEVMVEVAESLLGGPEPDWANVTRATLDDVVRALRKAQR